MLSREDNELLTRTGPGTAMGALLRHYWIPVVQSGELEPGGRVKRVQLLGERLIAFRAPNGRPGLVGEFCPHRGASLYFGRGRGGRDAVCVSRLEVRPGRPVPGDAERAAGVELRGQGRATSAYPCVEAGGVIWAYMGPASPPPPLPELEWTLLPREPHLHLQARAGLQLVPGAGRRHRLQPHLVPARAYRSHRRRQVTRGHGPRELRRGRRGADGRPCAALRGGRHRLRRGDRRPPHASPTAGSTGASRQFLCRSTRCRPPISTSTSCSRTSGCRWTTRTSSTGW